MKRTSISLSTHPHRLLLLCWMVSMLMVHQLHSQTGQADVDSVPAPREIAMAIDHYKSGNYRMGLIVVKGGLLKHPHHAELKLLGGIMEMKLRHFEQAHAFFSAAIEDGLDQGSVYFKRGLCNIENQQWQWACNDFTVAIERPDTVEQLMSLDQTLGQPSHGSYYLRMSYIKRAHALAQLGNIEAAVADIKRVPSLSENLGAEFYYVRGLIHYMTKNLDGSIQDLEMAEKIGIRQGDDFYHLYGKAALDLRNYDLAIEKLTQSLEFNSHQNITRRELAIALSLKGQNSMAIEVLGTNLIRNQDRAMVYFDLGYFHHCNGNPKLAREFFLKAAETEKDILELMEQFTQLTTAPHSPIHDFNTEAIKMARSYINTGAPPATIPVQNPYKPSISIVSVTSSPNPVPVNQAFELVTNFRATVPFTQTAKLNFHFIIRKNGKKLFQSQAVEVLAERGKLTNWTQRMKPVPKAGNFEVTVVLEVQGWEAQESTKLLVE